MFQYDPITQQVDVAYREHFQPLGMLSHHHNDYEIIYIVEGKVEFTIGGKTYLAGENDLLFINNIEFHEYKVLQYPYKRYVVMMTPHFVHNADSPLLTSILHHRPDEYSHLVRLDAGGAKALEPAFEAMLKEFSDQKPFWETSIRLLFYQLLVSLYRVNKQYFPLSKYENNEKDQFGTIVEIQKYIDSNYAEDLSLGDLSRQFHIDRYYLCHLFKDVTGYTFKYYLLMQRISIAKELLCHTGHSITEVCYSVGFNNVSHFIRTFKKYTGLTPYQYKKEKVGRD